MVENMLWEGVFVKEFRGSVESGWTKRNAILKTDAGVAFPVESPFSPHRHKHNRTKGSDLSQMKVPSI